MRRVRKWTYEAGLFALLMFLISTDEGRNRVSPFWWWVSIGGIGIAYAWLAGPYVWGQARQAYGSIRNKTQGLGSPPRGWTQTVISFCVVAVSVSIFIAMVVYATNRFASPVQYVATDVTFPDDAPNDLASAIKKLDYATETAEEMGDEMLGLNATIDELTEKNKVLSTELGVAGKREQALLEARHDSETRYSDAAKQYLNMADKSATWKAYKTAIDTMKFRMERQVNSDEHLAFWLLCVQQDRLVIESLSNMFGLSVNVIEPAPPSRELKPFRAYNAQHNEVLNDLDFHVKRLEAEVSQMESKPQ